MKRLTVTLFLDKLNNIQTEYHRWIPNGLAITMLHVNLPWASDDEGI